SSEAIKNCRPTAIGAGLKFAHSALFYPPLLPIPN
ncbi:MAG: hypothetical protein ACI8W9_001744, partial [Psychromonas sp.]